VRPRASPTAVTLTSVSIAGAVDTASAKSDAVGSASADPGALPTYGDSCCVPPTGSVSPTYSRPPYVAGVATGGVRSTYSTTVSASQYGLPYASHSGAAAAVTKAYALSVSADTSRAYSM